MPPTVLDCYKHGRIPAILLGDVAQFRRKIVMHRGNNMTIIEERFFRLFNDHALIVIIKLRPGTVTRERCVGTRFMSRRPAVKLDNVT